MNFSVEYLNEIFDFTEGYCYYCGKLLSWKNYGKVGKRGGWEIDHSNPKSRGGSDYLRNLVPACIPCNREKSDYKGSYYKKQYEPKTLGGQIVQSLGLPEGFFGASRRKQRI